MKKSLFVCMSLILASMTFNVYANCWCTDTGAPSTGCSGNCKFISPCPGISGCSGSVTVNGETGCYCGNTYTSE